MNARPYHLSRIISGEDVGNIDDILSDAHLFAVQMVDDYFTNIVQLFSTGMAPSDMKIAQNKHLVVKAIDYHLAARNSYALGADGILIRWMLEHERPMIIT
jgi:hypothetical protein